MIKCACNGKKCEGVCREKHLHRKRTFLKRCPAAYDVKAAHENISKLDKE